VASVASRELKDRGLESPSFAIRNDFTDPSRELAMEVERARAGILTAQRLGAQVVRAWTGTSEVTPAAAERVVSAFRQLAEFARPLGIDLAVETHGGISSDLAMLADVLDRVGEPRVGVCVDGGYLTDESFGQAFETFGARINHVHVKVHDDDGPGGPNVDRHLPLLRFVGAGDYGGQMVVEYEGKGPREVGVRWTRRLVMAALDGRAAPLTTGRHR
jgi:sugar phosphate isomerase/epimerase